MIKKQSSIQSSKKPQSKTEIEKSAKPQGRLVVTKQSSLIPQKKGICINIKLNKNVLSLIFGFFSCQDLLPMRFVCKAWNEGIISYIKLQTKFNPWMKKKTDIEDRHKRSVLEEEIAYIPNELLEVYGHFDQVTPDEIYTSNNQIRSVYPVFDLLFQFIIQFKLLKMPKYQSITENEDWRIGYVQVYIDKVVLPQRIEKKYTIRKFLRLFNKVNIDKLKQSLQLIRKDYINTIQYIPLLAKKIEVFLRDGITFYEQYQRKYPQIVEYMEVISELENNRKEIIIAKNICKKYK